MKKTILVTGAAGFLGTSLIELLLNQAEELEIDKIIGLDNLLFKEQAVIPLLRHPKFELVVGDVRDKQLLIELTLNADVVYPLAALVGAPICAKFPKEAEEINLGQIKTIVENMFPQTQVLYPCTNSIYGNSGGTVDENSDKRCLSVYAKTKYEGEQLVINAGGASLRLATLAGVSFRQRKDLLVNTMCLKAITDKYVLLYEPHFQRCYISVKDAARAFVHALRNYNTFFKGEAFNCGNTSLNSSKLELANTIKQYVPDFVIKIEDYLKDPDQRDYRVLNDKLEDTGFQCEQGFDTIIPQVLKTYKVLLETENFFLT